MPLIVLTRGQAGAGAGAALAFLASLLLVYSGSPRVLLATLLWLLSLGLVVLAFLPKKWPAALAVPIGTTSGAGAAPRDGAVPAGRRASWAGRTLAISGVGLASLGQWVLMGRDEGPAPVAGVCMLLAGAALFALGADRASAVAVLSVEPPSGDPGSAYGSPRARLATSAALLIGIVLCWRLLSTVAGAAEVLLWLALLAVVAVPLLLHEGAIALRIPRGRRADLLAALGFAAAFVALNARDLDHWYFAAIGDEYPFYQTARDILAGGVTRAFNQDGVYSTHPVLNSVYQALVMAVFGQDHVGWKLSSVLAVAMAVPAVYLLGVLLAGRVVAVVASALLVSSHYLFAIAHIGSNNAEALAPAAWAVALFVAAERRNSSLLRYIAGVAAGLGFYTFFSARTIVAVLGLFVVARRDPWRRAAGLWPLGLGFALAVAPIVLASRLELVTRMVAQVPGGYSSDVTGPIGSRLVANIWLNALAFNYSAAVSHYVSGSLFDPISAVLAVLGIGVALAQPWNESYRLLAIWYVVALAATGLLSPYPQVAVTRVYFCVPPLALLAAIGARHVWQSLGPMLPGRAARLAAMPLAGLLVLTVLGLNARRFWVESPSRMHLNQEAVAVGALQSTACGGDPARAIVVARSNGGVVRSALISYHPNGALPRFLSHDDLARGHSIDVESSRCVVFVYPDDEPERLALQALPRAYSDWRILRFTDPAQKGRVAILARGEPR